MVAPLFTEFDDVVDLRLFDLSLFTDEESQNALAGDDTVRLSDTQKLGQPFFGEEGEDTITGGEAADVIYGGADNDVLDGGNGNDVLIGGAGDDIMRGRSGRDMASYEDASSRVSVRLSNNTTAQDTQGGGFDLLQQIENLTGSAYDDFLEGSAGANQLIGGDGNDVLKGLDGDDEFIGGKGDDEFIGGAGVDRVSYIDADAGVTVSMLITGFQDTGSMGFDRLVSIARLIGSDHDDELGGNDLANRVFGGNGDDVVRGWGGHDEVYGNDGNDIIYGDASNDRLTGGSGNDIFVFQPGGAVDRVRDFELGDNRIQVEGFGEDFDTAAEVLAIARQKDGYVEIRLPDPGELTSTVIRIEHYLLTDLDESDFIVIG